MYCIYGVTEIKSGMYARSYLERSDQAGNVYPLLPDSTAYITATLDGHFTIANNEGEVLAIGNTGIEGIRPYLKLFRPLHTVVNGGDLEAYRVASSALVYFVYIRRAKDGTHFVAVEKTREGVSQSVKTFVGAKDVVAGQVRRYLARTKENYYVHYMNKANRLDGVPDRCLLKDFEHDELAIRDALRPLIAKWKERKENEAA